MIIIPFVSTTSKIVPKKTGIGFQTPRIESLHHQIIFFQGLQQAVKLNCRSL